MTKNQINGREQLEMLTYRTTTKEGYRQYASTPSICAACPVIGQCTQSKNKQKMIQRHIWQDYLDVAEYLRHNHEIKEIYGKRKETIERVFADAKEKHGIRWTTLRGLKKMSMQAITGSVDGEKIAINNVNNKLISIYFNSEIAM